MIDTVGSFSLVPSVERRRVRLPEVNFNEANLTETSFRYSEISESVLQKSILCRTVFPENFTISPDRDCQN